MLENPSPSVRILVTCNGLTLAILHRAIAQKHRS